MQKYRVLTRFKAFGRRYLAGAVHTFEEWADDVREDVISDLEHAAKIEPIDSIEVTKAGDEPAVAEE